MKPEKPPTVPLNYERFSLEEMELRAAAFAASMATRRSVREFSTRPVPRRLIELAIAAAHSAPSGANRQPWRFVAVSDPAVKREVRAAVEAEERDFYEGGRTPQAWLEALAPLGTSWRKPFLEVAPWLVVAFKEVHGVAPDGAAVTNYYVNESVGIACGLFIAAVHHMGLATLTHTPPSMRFLNRILGRPLRERPFILFPVGYPTEGCRVPDIGRKPLSDVVSWV
ncbi:MAG: nitroreductase family protein [Acidobacteriota bacterium]